MVRCCLGTICDGSVRRKLRTAVDEDDDDPANAASTAVVAVIKKGIHFIVVIEIYCGSQGIHKEKGYNIT